eukprot:334203-Prorocentrum_lima.AAC.1
MRAGSTQSSVRLEEASYGDTGIRPAPWRDSSRDGMRSSHCSSRGSHVGLYRQGRGTVHRRHGPSTACRQH